GLVTRVCDLLRHAPRRHDDVVLLEPMLHELLSAKLAGDSFAVGDDEELLASGMGVKRARPPRMELDQAHPGAGDAGPRADALPVECDLPVTGDVGVVKGVLFAHRVHDQQLTSPRQVPQGSLSSWYSSTISQNRSTICSNIAFPVSAVATVGSPITPSGNLACRS